MKRHYCVVAKLYNTVGFQHVSSVWLAVEKTKPPQMINGSKPATTRGF
jgi:hypothetical protein